MIAPDRLSTRLTEVELTHIPGKIERWIRFGRYQTEQIVDRRQRVLAFVSGEVFAFVRWASNDYGTVQSRLDILRAVDGEQFSAVPHVTPGAEILLRVSGWPNVKAVFLAIDQAETVVTDAADVCPDHWRHIHHRMSARLPYRNYTSERHRAWLLRRKVDQS
jgi:hypothetical protein